MNFGSTLRSFRLDADLSQRELARRADMDYTYLSKIEAGLVPPPSDDKIRALCRALGVSADDQSRLFELAELTKVPNEIVKDVLIRNPGVGALLRKIHNRRLTDKQIKSMHEAIDDNRRTNE